jgi:hypothetical protein
VGQKASPKTTMTQHVLTRAALVRTLKSQVSQADRVLQLPPTPETTAARGKLIAMAELARGSVKSYEEKGTLI